ncbi:FAD-dependent oxidoreductase [Plantactinospora sp. GCM10030261]|uniref:FAD-dependent oxidoreductase n=1 Tax=Plantactinospora sp. GCM10030261 TaxID=3273420 RepID=UPI003606C50D
MAEPRYDVVVVGAGVIGLTCAARLTEAGARVAVVTGDDPVRLVSRVAAAVWYPSHTAEDPRVLRWSRRGFLTFTGQAAAGVPGVALRPTRMLLRTAATEPPWWAAAVPDFRTEPPPAGGPYTGLWTCTVPSVEMGPYLDWLLERLVGAGTVLLRRRLDALADVVDLAPVVVNAGGLGAAKLAGDPAVHPARGRVVLVTNPGLHTSVRDEDDPAGITYVHPRSRDVVLGGTYEVGETDTGPDPVASRAIVDRCVALVPALAGVPVVAELAGLRPARYGGVRLERDPVGLPGGVRLVHCYGHGGAGMTLSWGCADDVAGLALDG